MPQPRREGSDLLAHVHLGVDGLDEREQQVNPKLERASVAAEQLHHVRLLWWHCPNSRQPNDDQRQEGDDDGNKACRYESMVAGHRRYQ